MIQCRRLGYLVLETPDLDRMAQYYEQVLGLCVVGRNAQEFYLTTRVGQTALHVKKGAAARCTGLSFEVSPALDTDAIRKELEELGLVTQNRSDVVPGVAQALSFTEPMGLNVDIFTRWQPAPAAGTNGVAPLKLGHAAFIVEDPKKLSVFYGERLGFRASDWVEEFFVFMRCGPDHHTVNFLHGDDNRIHHCAFEMKDSAHLIESCDILGQHKVPIIWGPVRHGPGHNVATYHIAPDGLIVELFAELDRMSDEELGYFDPRPWHEDLPQRPKIWPGKQRRDFWGPPIPADFLKAGSSLVR